MLPPTQIPPRTRDPKALSPSLPNSASQGWGAGLPALPLVTAPPGDGVQAAGLTTQITGWPEELC